MNKKIFLAAFILWLFLAPVKNASAAKTLQDCPYGLNYGGGGRPDIVISGNKHNYLLENIKKSGVCWIKVWLLWWHIESQPGIYNWEKYDYIIKKAHQENLKVLLTIHKTPQFYSNKPDREKYYNCPPKNTLAFKKFVTKAVKRYKDYVSIWQIGNEVYDNDCWQETNIYPEMLNSAADIIRNYSPKAEIASASISYYPGLGIEKFIKEWLSETKENFNYIVIHAHRPNDWEVRNVIDQVRNIVQEVDIDVPFIIGETSFNIKDNPQINPFNLFKRRITIILENDVQKVFWFKHINGPWGPGLFEKTDSIYSKTPLFNLYKELISENGWYFPPGIPPPATPTLTPTPINLSVGNNLINFSQSTSAVNFPIQSCFYPQKRSRLFWYQYDAQTIPAGTYFIKCSQPVTWPLN